MPGGRRPTSVEQRFFSRIQQAGDCWIWLNADGTPCTRRYGEIWVTPDRRESVHVFSYKLFVGEIPEGLTLDHLCRRTLCCNPWHLEPVPTRINILRSDSPPARNARKLVCQEGHALLEANLYVKPNGQRRCRTCFRAYKTAWKLRQKPPGTNA